MLYEQDWASTCNGRRIELAARQLFGAMQTWFGFQEERRATSCLAWLARSWAVFNCLLFGVTWRLWISQSDFPQVPLVRAAGMLVACLQPKVLELLSKMKIDPYPPPWACKTVAEAVSKLAEVG